MLLAQLADFNLRFKNMPAPKAPNANVPNTDEGSGTGAAVNCVTAPGEFGVNLGSAVTALAFPTATRVDTESPIVASLSKIRPEVSVVNFLTSNSKLPLLGL